MQHTLDVGARAAAIENADDTTILPSAVPVYFKRARRWRRSRAALCSLADEAYLKPLAISSATFEQYARRHRMDFVLRYGTLDQERPTAWSKIALIRELLEQYELVFWIDADAIFRDIRRDVRDELDTAHDVYVVEHRWETPPGRRSANTGVVVARATEWTDRFLRAVWDSTEFLNHEWWENTAVLHLLGYGIPDDGTPPIPGVRDSEWLERVGFLGLEWNSTEHASAAAYPLVRHVGRRPTPALLAEALLEEYRLAGP